MTHPRSMPITAAKPWRITVEFRSGTIVEQAFTVGTVERAIRHVVYIEGREYGDPIRIDARPEAI